MLPSIRDHVREYDAHIPDQLIADLHSVRITPVIPIFNTSFFVSYQRITEGYQSKSSGVQLMAHFLEYSGIFTSDCLCLRNVISSPISEHAMHLLGTLSLATIVTTIGTEAYGL